MTHHFRDRRDAGRQLATCLLPYSRRRNVLVLALPRGGVPVGFEVARALGIDLDVLIVRKLGVPQQPELAMGAIASGGARYLNEDVLRYTGVDAATLRAVEAVERAELQRREQLYRGSRPALQVRGQTVIVVDDGMATGASMQAAAIAVRSLQPAWIVVAVPVAPHDAEERLGEAVDEFVCVYRPAHFHGVGQFYQHFEQTTDAEVRELLEGSRKAPA